MWAILLILVLVVVGQIIGVSIAFVHVITKPHKITVEESIQKEKEAGFWGDYDMYPKKEWNIKGHGKYILHGELWTNSENRFVIVTHGYTDSRYTSLKYAHLFYKLGYQVYIYDMRFHGQNKGGYCSMGYYESQDIISIAEEIRKCYGADCQIGLHGVSLGATSSLMALGKSQNFSFVIEDCGFSDFKELMKQQAKSRFHLPSFFAQLVIWMNMLMHGYSFAAIKLKNILLDNQVPILFIHGLKDDFIPVSMCEDMYQITTAEKNMVLFPDGKHADSYCSNPALYEASVEAFINKYGK